MSGGSPAIRLRFRRFSSTWMEVVIISIAVGALGERRAAIRPICPRRRSCQASFSPSTSSLCRLTGISSCCIRCASCCRSTAITISAPSARVSETGTGFTTPPSTNQYPLWATGAISPGILQDARTAISPSVSHSSLPVLRLVATAPNGSWQ